MNADFSRTLALLRQEKEISQRKAAADLGISQALLSHYENGVREPGLAFVKKACDYYHVSADYLLGRTLDRDGGMIDSDELYDSSDEKGTLRGSIAATLQKKLLVNTVNLLFELLGKTNCREAVTAAGQYLGAAIYLITGKTYCPRVCVEQPDMSDLCALLRRLYHEEACGGFNYARAADETLDLCLGKMFAAMSEDEYRHAELLMKLLGRRIEG